MLRVHTIPGSLLRVLDPFRPCFTAPTFATFVTLLAGMIARPAHRTVCGMLAGAGLAGCGITAGAPVLRCRPLVPRTDSDSRCCG